MAITPPSLNPGDVIGIAAPAGYLVERDRYHRGCSILSEMGFQIFEPEKNWPGYGYLANDDRGRLHEFHKLWAEPSIKAIFALRGGFGSLRLLENLDVSVIRKNPKLFLGFSDISILHNHLFHQTGLICMHGPGLSSLASADKSSLDRLYHCLRGNWHTSLNEPIEIIRASGSAEGPLLGGNLTSIVTMLGTPWFPDLSGAILLLEDINEPLYRLDRLLTQLFYSGWLNKVNGIILGQFSDTENPVDRLKQNEFVWNRIVELTYDSPIPIWGNFPVGHVSKNITIPIGAQCVMEQDTGHLHFSIDE